MKKLLNMKEAMEYLSVSKQTLQRWDNEGKLKAVRTEGGHRRYNIDDLKAFANGHVFNSCKYTYGTLYEVLCEAQYQADVLEAKGMVDSKTCNQLQKIRESIGKKHLNEFFEKKHGNDGFIECAADL